MDIGEFCDFLGVPFSPLAQRCFELINETGNGKISFSEFIHGMWDYCVLDDQKSKVFWYRLLTKSGRGMDDDVVVDLRDVRRAGSWKRYSNVPRLALLVLQKLCWRRRAAAPPGLLARLFPQEPQGRRRKRRTVEAPAIEELEATSGCKVTRPRTRKDAHDAAPLVLPDELFWKCLSFWKSSRDP